MKKNMTGNRKFNRKRFAAAAGAGLTAAAVLITAVLGRSIDAEAADTLIGIEKLRTRVKDSGKEYVVLEVVPDRAAAEIGFLFEDLEPILSEWDHDAMEWNRWENILCSLPDFDSRRKYIEDKKEELRAYYEQAGIKGAFPVEIEDEEYAESPEPASGFRKITSDGTELTGWFVVADPAPGQYQVAFRDDGQYDSDGSYGDTLYYTVKDAQSIQDIYGREGGEDELEQISGDTYIYQKISTSAQGEFYSLAGTWEELQDAIMDSVMSEPDDVEDEEDEKDSEKRDDKDRDDDEDDKKSGDDDGDNADGDDTDDGNDDGGENGGGDGDDSGEGGSDDGNDDDGEGGSDGSDDSGDGGNGGGSSNGDDNGSGDNGNNDSGDSGNSGSGSGGSNNQDNDDNKKEDSESSTDSNTQARLTLSAGINQSGWYLLAGNEEPGDSDVQQNTEDKDSDDDDSDNKNSNDSDSGDEDSKDKDADDDKSEGQDSDGSEDDGGYADDMDSLEGEDSEDSENNEEGTEDEGDEDEKSLSKDVLAAGTSASQYYIVKFEKVNNLGSLNNGKDYIYYVDQSSIVESSSGVYNFVEWKEDDESQANAARQTYTFPGRTIYCKNTFKSNEWFRKYVINMDSGDYKDFPVKVLTLTPKELNSMKQLPDFDFLYLNSGVRTWGESDPGVVSDDSDDDDDQDDGSTNKVSFGKKDDTDTDDDDSDADKDNDDGDDGNADDTDNGDDVDNGDADSADDADSNNGDDDGDDSDADDSDGGSAFDIIKDNDGDSSADDTDSDSENEDGSSGADSNTGKWDLFVEAGIDDQLSDSEESNDNEGDDNSVKVPDGEGEPVNSEEGGPVAVDEENGNGDEPGTGGGEGEPGTDNGEGGGAGEDDPDAETTYATYLTEGSDLSDEVLQYFFDKAIAGAKPCLVDGSILYILEEGGAINVNTELEKTNVFRLSAMLCQENLSDWYESHRNNYKNLTTKQLMDGIQEDANKNFVTEQVYCRFGEDSIINSLFSTATIYEEGGEMEQGFQPVLDEILLENLYREADSSGNYKPLSTDISQAKAIRHILNYPDRRKVETKEHVKVLEIQPALADEPELTLEQLKAWAPGVKTADITVMTTSEFIGKIEKLNENYDLIYIGTSKDHLNMRYWTDKTYTGKPDKDHIAAGTVFNDMDMDGLIYYNIGDLRVVSMPLAGQLDSEYWGSNRNDNVYYYNYVRYPGNDITEEKKEALLSFLDGSYPVIVADDFFESPVTVYATGEYTDGRVNLSEGDYSRDDLIALGIAGGDISAVKVKEGYKITLYNSWDLTTQPNRLYSISFTEDVSNLNSVPYAGGGNWNNKTYSLKVERIGDEVPARTIDGDHIDNCTYLYEFVKQAMDKKYVNFYAWSDITDESELFKFYLNRPKVSLTDVTVGGETKEGSGSDVRYIEAGINGKYNLQYSFIIKNEGAASYNTRYQCKLYIDINSDGKFSEQEEISDISLTQGGGYASPNELYADRRYVLSREVPSGYKGLLPWKVEITQVDNKNIYTSMQGYTKLEGMEPEQIRVIQIGRDRITDVGWEGLGWNEDLFNLRAEIEGTTNYANGTENYFHTLVYGGQIGDTYYEGITNDFEIDVTFHTISEFETIYYGGTYQADGENEAAYHDGNPYYLDDFNMLILGFSDMYGDFSGNEESGPMGAILDFVNSGKSVLFAHDTTSYFNYEKKDGNYSAFNGVGYPYNDDKSTTASHGDYHNASTLNKYLRNLVGMDRYGVLTSDILRRGNALTSGSGEFDQVVSSRYDVAYKPKSGKKETVPQVQGYTYLIINAKDFDHRDTNTDRTEFYEWNVNTKQTGQTEDELGRKIFTQNYTNIRYDTVQYKNGETDADRGRRNGEIAGNRNGEIDHVNVTQVNQGQITEYPYKLAEKFEVAETHGQYYQLDYTADDDGDGESDLVVWYCLNSRYDDGETIYTQSPNDVRNNYYIYNKGNITYTGMGHNVHKSGKYTLEEAKLFINTIIAAYQAGVKDPYINVLKKGVPESEELKTLYRYYDPTNDFYLDDSAATETYEKIYFTVQDINFIKGTRQMESHVFYQADGGGETITVNGEEIAVNRLADDFYDASTGSPVSATDLVSGGIYYIQVPRSVLQQCETGLDLYFEAQTRLTTSTTKENVYETAKVYAKLKVLQAYLFNLE